MTRIAVISDIHANLLALDAVLKDIRRQKVDNYWMLGDAVGYGYNPDGVMDRLRELPIEPGMWLAGNHDWGMVALEYPSHGLMPTAEWGDALISLRQQHNALRLVESKEGYIRQLRDLSYYARPRPNIFAAHGAYYPDSAHIGMLRYIKDRAHIEADYIANQIVWDAGLTDGQPVIVINGHHHRPALWERQPSHNLDVAQAESTWKDLPLPFDEPVKLTPGMLYHLNPGSVGFQRDMRYPCPTYLILEDSGTEFCVQYRYVPYDTERARERMRSAGVIPEIYQKRLLRCKPLT